MLIKVLLTYLLFVPHLHFTPKLGFTNLIVNCLFARNRNLKEQLTDQLGIGRKECHGKSFEDCSKLLSFSAFLKEVVPTSDHPLVECLEVLHRVVAGVFG